MSSASQQLFILTVDSSTTSRKTITNICLGLQYIGY